MLQTALVERDQVLQCAILKFTLNWPSSQNTTRHSYCVQTSKVCVCSAVKFMLICCCLLQLIKCRCRLRIKTNNKTPRAVVANSLPTQQIWSCLVWHAELIFYRIMFQNRNNRWERLAIDRTNAMAWPQRIRQNETSFHTHKWSCRKHNLHDRTLNCRIFH